MLILLPPSETKRSGGTGRSLRLGELSFPALGEHRSALIDALVALSADEDAAVAALKLGRTQRGAIAVNRALTTAPTMPAVDRYTGVLYDGLDAASLDERARAFAGRHLVIHSALFGPVGALDAIPEYRLSHDSRVPGMTLKRHWRSAVSSVLSEHAGLVLDMRSEGYAGLGPAPSREGSVYLRVLTEGDGGVRRALNHFNKKAKGELARVLLETGRDVSSVDELVGVAAEAGLRLEPHGEELALVV